MKEDDVVKYLEALLSGGLADGSEGGGQGVAAAVVSCMDGRLNEFLKPFMRVIRTAGAVTEPVEGSIGVASDATDVTLLATHGDCLAYQAAIRYLAACVAGKTPDLQTVRNFNRGDTKSLLVYLSTQRSLNKLPDPDDQRAQAELAIQYAVQWTSRGEANKPRVGLFVDGKGVLAAPPRVWVVSHNRLTGPELANFLSAHGMSQKVVATHALDYPVRPQPQQLLR